MVKEMTDIVNVLKQAKENKLELRCEEIKDVIKSSLIENPQIKVDWDNGAGEEWVRLYTSKGLICMFHTRLRIAFARKLKGNICLSDIEKHFFVVNVENYSEDSWCIDIDRLHKDIPEIVWHASDNAVNPQCFSLDDFYFATI